MKRKKTEKTMPDQWDNINYPELSAEDNELIRKARRAGYAAMFPAFPTAEAQSRNTLNGARKFLREVDEIHRGDMHEDQHIRNGYH
jgi:hypothetical protein